MDGLIVARSPDRATVTTVPSPIFLTCFSAGRFTCTSAMAADGLNTNGTATTAQATVAIIAARLMRSVIAVPKSTDHRFSSDTTTAASTARLHQHPRGFHVAGDRTAICRNSYIPSMLSSISVTANIGYAANGRLAPNVNGRGRASAFQITQYSKARPKFRQYRRTSAHLHLRIFSDKRSMD